MGRYREFCGTIVKKQQNCLGQYVFRMEDETQCISVCVGTGLFEMYEIGSKVTVGLVGRKLINIRPATDESH